MVRPGVNVSTSTVAGRTTVGERVGTWFVAGITEAGPTTVDPSRPITSITDFIDIYGSRVSYGTLYDAVDTYFRLGGNRVFVSRVVGPSASVATLNLNDGATPAVDTLQVDAKGPGSYGERIKVAVTAGTETGTYVLTISYDDVVKEVSPDLSTPAEAVQWALTSSRFVTITDLSSATAAPNNNPKVAAATALVGGDDDRANIVTATWEAAIGRFVTEMGPGLVSAPTVTASTTLIDLVEHAQANNRQALLDAADGATDDTTAALADTIRSDVAEAADRPYGALLAPWVSIPGVAAGTTRKVPPSAVAAGLISKQVRSGPSNQPAAGRRGKVPLALDLGQTAFTDAERELLNAAGVCVFHKPHNSTTVTLYGYRTLDLTQAWRNLSNQLLRIVLTDEALTLGEDFMFEQIDGRGHTIARFNGALRGLLHAHWNAGELYGERADEAYQVDTGSGVNTPESLANNELRADIQVRMSPFAEMITINVVKYPITESIEPVAA